MTSCGRWRARPLRNVLGKALRGRSSFEARNYLFSFPSYVHFEEFFVSSAFAKFGAKRSSPGGFGFDDVLELFLKTALRHQAFSWELRLQPRVFYENFFSFFEAEPVLLAWHLWWSPGWAKPFGGSSSKIRMETWFPGVGQIERRRTVDRRRGMYESLVVIHGPKETKARRTQPVITLYRLQKPASFEEPVSETGCFYRFAIHCFPVCGCTVARWSGCRSGTAKKSSHPWHFRCWSPSRNDLECTNLVH